MGTKEKILMAIYQESKSGKHCLHEQLSFHGLRDEDNVFKNAVQALQAEGLIQGAVIVRDRFNDLLHQVILNQVGLTHRGLYYVQSRGLAVF